MTRSQLLRARKKDLSRPAGMEMKTAGQSSGLVYTMQTQNERVRELLGLDDDQTDYLRAKKEMLTTALKKYQRIGLGYVAKPQYATRSEMLAARRRANLPPLSYDFNGDGVVDNFELFLGSRMDVNGDGEISETERARGKELLEELKENYTFGLDAAGANTNAYADIEKRATKTVPGSQEEALAEFIATKTKEAVQPPWAVTARRGFHDSARSGYSQIGTAYYKDLFNTSRSSVAGGGETSRTNASAATAASRASQRSGMSRLIGV